MERAPEFSGTRPESDFFWATQTRLFQVGYIPDPTRTRPYEKTHKIWSKKFRIPDKIPDFLGTGIRLLEFPPDPNPTFYYPIYSIPDFLLPDPPLHLISKSYFDIEQGIKFQSFIVTMHSFKKRDHLIFQSINCAHKNLKRKNFDFTSFLGERTIYFNPKKVQCCHDRKTFRELSTRYLKPPAMVSYEKCQISTSFADF